MRRDLIGSLAQELVQRSTRRDLIGPQFEERVQVRGLHGLKTEARTRPVPEIVWPNPTRPERHG